MKTCSESLLMLLNLMHLSLLSVLEAQEAEVQPEVTGYLGHDVTLPCRLIQGPPNSTITQVQWDVKQPDKEKVTIIVSNANYGESRPDTFLKERVKLEGQSLTIMSVNKMDAGLYTCSLITYPSGSFEGTTNFVVQEQMPLSSGVVSAVVIAVLLLFLITAAIAYVIFIRRRRSSCRHRVYIDTSGTAMDVARPSVIVKEDVLYSDVKLKPSTDFRSSSTKKHKGNVHADDVTYAEVVILRQQPD